MKVKISLVSYLNTLPFLYGIENNDVLKDIDLALDIPSVCANKLLTHQVDLGLVPVAILPKLKEYHIISDFCIGAKKKVNSVFLISDVPLNQIDNVLLDYQSETSVNLAKVLANKYWNIQPEWIKSDVGYENKIKGNTAGVVIGDRAFDLSQKFKYKFDLAEEWNKFTNLPFAFACWVSNKELPNNFVIKLNEALSYGVNNIENSLSLAKNNVLNPSQLESYLTEFIDYNFDNEKKKSVELFLKFLNEMVAN